MGTLIGVFTQLLGIKSTTSFEKDLVYVTNSKSQSRTFLNHMVWRFIPTLNYNGPILGQHYLRNLSFQVTEQTRKTIFVESKDGKKSSRSEVMLSNDHSFWSEYCPVECSTRLLHGKQLPRPFLFFSFLNNCPDVRPKGLFWRNKNAVFIQNLQFTVSFFFILVLGVLSPFSLNFYRKWLRV